jgi:hypothetical protein
LASGHFVKETVSEHLKCLKQLNKAVKWLGSSFLLNNTTDGQLSF